MAVLDTGIRLSHPDLNVVRRHELRRPGHRAERRYGHGTHIAGTIGALNNGSGVVGVAPGTKLFSVKVLERRRERQLRRDHLRDRLGDRQPRPEAHRRRQHEPDRDRVHRPARSRARRRRRRCTRRSATRPPRASLTSSRPATTPATSTTRVYPSVPAGVPAGAHRDRHAGPRRPAGSARADRAATRTAATTRTRAFSNYASVDRGAEHTIAAPGVCIESTFPRPDYKVESGTSVASPHVAGLVALCIGEVNSGPRPVRRQVAGAGDPDHAPPGGRCTQPRAPMRASGAIPTTRSGPATTATLARARAPVAAP